MPIVEFLGPSLRDSDNVQAEPMRLVNYYRERVGSRNVLKCVPGATSFSDTASPIGRDMIEVNAKLYAVTGGSLFTISSGGTATNLGLVSDDADTFMAGYGANVMVTAGGNYYVYDGVTLSAVTGGRFTSIGSVAFVGGYTILTQLDGSEFEWTTLQDPKTRVATNFATHEGQDDKVLRAMEFGGNLYLFGTKTTEIWGLTGLANEDAFSRLPGGVINTGVLAPSLVTSFGDGLFFVGDDNIARVMVGSTTQPVGHAGVTTAISETVPDRAFYYEHEGHKFCVLRFSDRPAWIYDIAMGEWHERGSGPDLQPWSIIGAAKAYGSWRTLDRLGETFTVGGTNDDGASIVRKAVSTTLEMNGRRFRASEIEIRARGGFHTLGRDAQIMLRISRDRGATWTAPKQRSLGDIGEYNSRTVWRSQGLARNLTLEISQGDDASIPLFADALINVFSR